LIKFQVALVSFFLFSISAMAAPVCDGVTDDTAAIFAAGVSGERIPAGTCRVTADIALTATSGFQPGLRLMGAGMLRTKILADYNGNVTAGAIFRFDQSGAGNYTVGTEISDLSIEQAPGRTGLNGIQLTAAWMVEIKRVKVSGLSGKGIVAPVRTDINPISDYYQDFSVIITQSWIANNVGWGIDFGAGQSPGLFKLQYSAIANNAGGGIRTSTGQNEIVSNLIVGNGTYGGYGGLFFDTVEGPQFVAKVEQNEFQDNYSWHIHMLRSRGMEIRQNRFLSATFSANQGGSYQSGSSIMRPYVHVNLGSGAANEVWSLIAEHNYHRSVTGPSTTTASVIAYAASTASLSSAHPVHIRYNDFGNMPADGVSQNSTGLTKFSGFSGTGAQIIDP
jgi:hypothetical protein